MTIYKESKYMHRNSRRNFMLRFAWEWVNLSMVSPCFQKEAIFKRVFKSDAYGIPKGLKQDLRVLGYSLKTTLLDHVIPHMNVPFSFSPFLLYTNFIWKEDDDTPLASLNTCKHGYNEDIEFSLMFQNEFFHSHVIFVDFYPHLFISLSFFTIFI